MRSLLTALFILLLPVVVFVGGAVLMEIVSGRAAIKEPEIGRLGLRFTGYGTKHITTYWEQMKANGDTNLQAERRFLQLDLLFAPLYCSAIAFSLYLAWMKFGDQFSLWWLILPIAIALLADWTENYFQLDLVANYIAADSSVDDNYVRVASTATIAKAWSVSVGTVLLLGMVAMIIVSELRQRSQDV